MADHLLSPVQPRRRGPSTISARRTLAIVIAIGVVGALVANAFVIVDPTEMAGKRLLGRVVVDQPLGPGLHFKLPSSSRSTSFRPRSRPISSTG